MNRRYLPLLIAAGLPLGLGGCAVGANYAGPPKVVAQAGFVRGEPGGDGPVMAQWWQALGDARLDGLEAEALAHSPSVAEAQARIAESIAVLGQQKSNGLPTVSPSLVGVKADLPSFTGRGKRTNLEVYNLGAMASWEPDFWGLARQTKDAARATVAQRQAQLADTQVSLSAQVAQAYVNLRDAQGRAGLLRDLVGLRARALELTRQRQGAGTATQADVARAQGDWQAALAQQAPVAGQIAVALDQLAVLTGRAPGELDAALGVAAALPSLPAQVAVGDPAALIARRPDIRAAERALAGSTAQVNVARAKLMPRLSFSGILGMGSSSLDSLVDPSTMAVGVLPQLKWSGLDWGKARASVHQAKAQRDAGEAAYRRVVLSALEDAESSLARFGAARERLAHLDAGTAAARQAAGLGAQRVAQGTSSGLEQIEREVQLVQAGLSGAQGRAELVGDYIAVAKALGLGWQE
jgi:NodT family efflux transporter outer membrane factor (OMF) lipoprotein